MGSETSGGRSGALDRPMTYSGKTLAQTLSLRWRLADARSGAAILLVPSFFAVFVIAFIFSDDVPPMSLVGWAAVQFLFVGLLAALFVRMQLDEAPLARLQRRWRLIQLTQGLITAGWMAIFPYLTPVAGPREMSVLGIVATAVYCATLIVHRGSPRAATFHILALSGAFGWCAFLVAGWRSWPTFLLIGTFGAVLLAAVWLYERNFKRSVRSEIDRREAEETVRMLLNDYQEHTSDWLWTVEPNGNLHDVGPRLAAAFGSNTDALEGTALAGYFDDTDNRQRLIDHLAEGEPFRDLLLQLRVEGARRFWRLSAHPRQDGRMSGVARDVTDNRRAEEQIAYLAHFDSLTGLANRHQFDERLRNALNAKPSRSRNLALFYLDLDDFKSINDTRGHLTGDKVLRQLAGRLGDEVRPSDIVARLGGDEFAILLESRAGVGMLIERAHRFLSAVREPLEVDGHLYRLSTSIGVARCSESECDAQELMRRADLALFAAKRKGRDTLALYEPAMDREARERRDLESDLREALSRGELRVHYQPVIDLDTAETTGYEALLRWHHPYRGLIGPNEFLELAETTGLILPIGEWVIRQALAETAPWAGDFRIAINLSPTQVRSPQLVSQVAQAIYASGIDPDRIEFEITEHVLMQEGKRIPEALARLRALGTRIALDDFGTGYSSLSYLRRFPFDRIKIDRKFVEDVVEDNDSQAIVSSITRLADALGMASTAEGIETREQLDLLRKLGCQEAQGFLICKPAPAETFATPEAVEAALTDHGPDVVDYRKAREAVLRKREGRVA